MSAIAADDQRLLSTTLDTYKQYRSIKAKMSTAEIAERGLHPDEEVQLQKNVLAGHLECLRRAEPGYNLAEYGNVGIVVHV